MIFQLWVATNGLNNWAHLRLSGGDEDHFICGAPLDGFSYWLKDMGPIQGYAWCAECLRSSDRLNGGDGNMYWTPTTVGEDFIEGGLDACHSDQQAT